MTMQMDEQKTDTYEETEVELSEPETVDEPEESGDLLAAFLENGIVKGEDMFSPYVIKNLDKFDERNCQFCKQDFLQLKGRKPATYCCNAHRKAQFVKNTKAESEASGGNKESNKPSAKAKKLMAAAATGNESSASGKTVEAATFVTIQLPATGNDASITALEIEPVKAIDASNESKQVTKVAASGEDNRYHQQSLPPSSEAQLSLPEVITEESLPTANDLENSANSKEWDSSEPIEESLPTPAPITDTMPQIPATHQSGSETQSTSASLEMETTQLLLDSIVTSLTAVTKEACDKAEQTLTEMETLLNELVSGASGNETKSSPSSVGNVPDKERVAELNRLAIRAGEKVWLLEKHTNILINYLQGTGIAQAKVKPSASQTSVITTLTKAKAVKDKFRRVVTLLRGNVTKSDAN